MRYLALATDYYGTIAHHGKVDGPTLAALERARQTGRRRVLVSGRELEDLQKTFDRLDLFDAAVLENGALIYRPATREETALGPPPPPAFVEELRRRGVGPVSVGRVIVATWEPHEKTVLEVIRDQGREMQVIFNKGAVMILPSGVNKASGLAAALEELGLSPHNTVGIGDAENDHAFLALCECSAAVANALPALKERADLVMSGARGAGVEELIEHLLADDLAGAAERLHRHAIRLGRRLEELDIEWFEEPISPEDIDGYVQVTQALDMAIAGGENEFTRWGFRDAIARKAMDIVQPDVCAAGGISECKKIAALATTHGVECVPHAWGSAVGLAATLHFLAALPDQPPSLFAVPPMLEFEQEENPFRDHLADPLTPGGPLDRPGGRRRQSGGGAEIDVGAASVRRGLVRGW